MVLGALFETTSHVRTGSREKLLEGRCWRLSVQEEFPRPPSRHQSKAQQCNNINPTCDNLDLKPALHPESPAPSFGFLSDGSPPAKQLICSVIHLPATGQDRCFFLSFFMDLSYPWLVRVKQLLYKHGTNRSTPHPFGSLFSLGITNAVWSVGKLMTNTDTALFLLGPLFKLEHYVVWCDLIRYCIWHTIYNIHQYTIYDCDIYYMLCGDLSTVFIYLIYIAYHDHILPFSCWCKTSSSSAAFQPTLRRTPVEPSIFDPCEGFAFGLRLAKGTAHVRIGDVIQILAPARIFHLDEKKHESQRDETCWSRWRWVFLGKHSLTMFYI